MYARTSASEARHTVASARPRPFWSRCTTRTAVVSTLAYLLLYLLARPALGPQWANAMALLLTAVANTAANRRFTFGVSGSDGVGRHQLQGLVVFGLGLALTSGSLATLHALVPTPARLLEVGVLVGANALATVLRFVLLRVWVFNRR
jgi:putative flippase GtrA